MQVEKTFEKYSEKGTDIVHFNSFDSPIGKIIAVADDSYIYMISFEDSKNFEKMVQSIAHELNCKFVEGKNKLLKSFGDELEQYFSGGLKKFSIPLKTIGSDFQKDVWNKLIELPYGSTQTYSDIANLLGRPSSHARAVGAACGANAHILVIPCHRVVATGSKGGFSCGVSRKEQLLQLEEKYK